MPELFVDLPSFVACVLIMAVAQLIYTTVGFGAGMFAVALMALVLPDLTDIVVILLVLTFVTETWVLAHTWRRAKILLLGWLVPGMAIGLWLGTQILAATDVSILKRLLGLVIIAAGAYFARQQWVGRGPHNRTASDSQTALRKPWITLPVGLLSGFLGAIFGTGGPPVIIFLRTHRLEKAAFRSTILLYFLLMGLLRAGTYAQADLVTSDRIAAAALLLPGSLAGVVIGMGIHSRISERRFSQAVALLLVILGVLLVTGIGR